MKKLKLMILTFLLLIAGCEIVPQENKKIVDIVKESYKAMLGETIKLDIRTSGNYKLVYEIEDENICSINKNQITTKNIGETSVKVYIEEDPTIYDTTKIVVLPKEVLVNIEEEEINLEVNKQYTLNITSTSNELEYFSSDEKVVKVSNGIIEGLDEGSAMISVFSKENPLIFDTVKVEVYKNRSLDIDLIYNEEIDKNTYTTIEYILDSEDAIVEFIPITSNIELINNKVKGIEAGIGQIKVKVIDPTIENNYKENIIQIIVSETDFLINYELNGIIINEKLIETYNKLVGLKLTEVTSPDYDFLGWYLNGELIDEIKIGTTGDLNLVGKFELKKIGPFNIVYDLNGGLFECTYETFEDLGSTLLKDYNTINNSNVSKTNFMKDSVEGIKVMLSDSNMINKWKWLLEYMLSDLTNYNQNNLTVSYVKDSLELLPLIIEGNTTTIKDKDKGPNLRTMIRSYFSSIMNLSKGSTHNPTFALYTPDFSNENHQYELLLSQIILSDTVSKVEDLKIPTRQYYNFVGWYDINNELVSKLDKDMKIFAKWEEINPVESIIITNKVDKIFKNTTYQLTWNISPSDAANKEVEFISSNKDIASIDEFGLIKTISNGEVTITIKSKSSSNKIDSFTFKVCNEEYFNVSYHTNSYVGIGDTIIIDAAYVDELNNHYKVAFTPINDFISVDNNGVVRGLKEGIGIVRISYGDLYKDIPVTVLANNLSDALALIINGHESNVYVEYELGIGAGGPAYYTDIIGSVSKLLYNEELEINLQYNEATNNKYKDELKNRLLESVEFITVHYTGSMGKNDTAKAIAAYFALPLTQNKTSIHYSTGNDGIYRGMDEIYRAAHAGDDGSLETVEKFEWLDTGLDVLENDPKFPVVSITKNSTFSINGRDTNISVPIETKFGRGYVTDDKWLNEMDLAVNIKDGKYQLGTSWWCYTQVWEGRICSNGGNRNSIGIESCVNEGSDLWYTWQKTAMLVADIMYRYDLDITRVKGHHFFSAKNCPQPMLENELRLWDEFILLVEAEYEKRSNYNNYSITFNSNSEYVNNHGRIIEQPKNDEVIEYSVTINNETIKLFSIIEGSNNK
ncbi:MAG: N-acetylmuramoyl-L-alanine amidase [Bacilli bacterium]|nr:N-acetylmuramoyl-L-alanine amidase [Bacilli bacterium]